MKNTSDTRRQSINTLLSTIILNFVAIATGIDASVDYRVEGDGFHRIIRYHVNTGKFFQHNCYIALRLSPDHTLYVNVDELKDLQRHGQTTACSDGEINVELFTEVAKYQNITACTPLDETDNFLSIPIHQRYRLSNENNEYTNTTLPEPVLLLGCKERIKEYGVSSIDLCSPCVNFSLKWRQIPYKTKTKNYVWTVPVGNILDRDYITFVTLFAVWSGTVILLRALWHSRDNKGHKRN